MSYYFLLPAYQVIYFNLDNVQLLCIQFPITYSCEHLHFLVPLPNIKLTVLNFSFGSFCIQILLDKPKKLYQNIFSFSYDSTKTTPMHCVKLSVT